MPKVTPVVLLSATVALLGACSQFTTNDVERAAMRDAADTQADAYLDCIRRESRQYIGSVADATLLHTAVADQCTADLEAFRASAEVYYLSKVMLTEEPVAAEVAELERRSRTMIAEMALGGAALIRKDEPLPAAATAPAPAPAPAPAAAPDRDSYFACLSQQARRYAGLSETAATIAEVAQDTCAGSMGESASAALAQEGRTRVLREVLETRAPQ